MYETGNPVLYSGSLLRNELRAAVAEFDPDGTDTALQEMVVIGHSQGGLLARLQVADSGDAFWHILSDAPFEELEASPQSKEWLRGVAFFERLPFVRRVVFIATPHRGSFVAGGLIGKLGSSLVSLPGRLTSRATDLLSTNPHLLPADWDGEFPTSVDNMDPEHPFTKTISSLPIAPGVAFHTIAAIDGDDEPPEGDDGVVEYTSAHLDGADSELIVRSGHSTQSHPRTILEVRRILHEALREARIEREAD